MIKSMTGYGSAESVLNGRKYSVEVKSLNHRYLEISLRLPAVLAPLEMEIRKKISGSFFRGRVDATIKFETDTGEESGPLYELNVPRARAYYALLDRLRKELNMNDAITLGMVMEFKDIFVLAEQSHNLSAIWEELEEVLEKGIFALLEMRKREGETILKDLMARMHSIERYIHEIEQRAPLLVEEYKKRLRERIHEISSEVTLDETRLSQEVVLMAERSDITEEVIRLKSHISQFFELLRSNDAVGRNLDFLLQEMNREVNTIGSKSTDTEISRRVIDIKSELAKIREQVQNIE